MSEFSNKALGLLSIDIPIPEFLIISISAFPLPKVITYEREVKTEWWDDGPSKKIFLDNGVQLETPIRKDNWAPYGQ